MPDTTAKIRAKGLDSTGVTEELANQLFAQRGTHHMAIIEYKVEETHQKSDGTRKVDLVLTQVEPATDDNLEDHLRELTRTLYYNRGTGEQPTLPAGSDEPTVEGVLAAGAKHRPHPFLPVDATQTTPICDVCGLIEAAGVHSTQDTLDDPDEDDGPDEAEQQAIRDQIEQDAADALHGDGPEPEDQHDETAITEGTDEEPWEYDAPEGQGADTKPIAADKDTTVPA